LANSSPLSIFPPHCVHCFGSSIVFSLPDGLEQAFAIFYVSS
jgi:hypothetical protein